MTAPRVAFEVRRAELVARAAADREALARELAPLSSVERALEWVSDMKAQLPGTAIGAGLGLSAFLLALPAGKSSLVRGGVALFQFAASVKRLISTRRNREA